MTFRLTSWVKPMRSRDATSTTSAPDRRGNTSPEGEVDLVFVYGTLKRGGLLHHYLRYAEFVAEVELHDHRMYNVGFCPAIAASEGGVVTGEVFEVEPWTMGILDGVEGMAYRRTIVTLDLPGRGERQVYTYVWRGHVDDMPEVEGGVWDATARVNPSGPMRLGTRRE
jgi:gamma-glutamylcyclotransferase (GGCT)/AIG2-like uncharacterized protein YtfP